MPVLVAIAGACLLLAGCSTFVVLNAAAPGKGFSRHTDIVYRALPRQMLDVYLPDTAARRALPVVVFSRAAHGRADRATITGSWARRSQRAAF